MEQALGRGSRHPRRRRAGDYRFPECLELFAAEQLAPLSPGLLAGRVGETRYFLPPTRSFTCEFGAIPYEGQPSTFTWSTGVSKMTSPSG